MGLMNNREKESFLKNINRIISSLGCDEYNINYKYEDFPIPRSNLIRWKKSDVHPNKKTFVDSGFLSFYNQNFEPKIDNSDCFFTKELGNIKTKNPDAVVELLPKYAGEYYLYYFSNHYENIIHSGKILIFLNSQQILARMIIGIQNDIPFKNKAFNNIFDKDISNDYAYTLFEQYKKTLKTHLQKRCYFYEGTVCFNDFGIEISFVGKEKRSQHQQRLNLIFNKSSSNKREYLGGLGLVQALPNNQHTSYRCYKMGLSKYELPFDDSQIKEMLEINILKHNRLELTPEDDLSWYDLIILIEEHQKQLIEKNRH